MHWKTHNSMTEKQKEEYNFRFKNKPIILSINSLIYLIIIYMLVTMLFIFTLYIGQKENILPIEQMIKLRANLLNLPAVSIYIILGWVLYTMGQIIYFYVKEYLWKKKNNIRKVK